MNGWTLRVVWPVEDPELSYSDMIRLATEDLVAVAARSGALIVGEPKFVTEETEQDWPETELALVCVVEAVPALEDWPTVIAQLAGEGWTDPRIGELLRVPSERVRGVRRRYGIAAAVPQGYSSRKQIKAPREAA